MKRFRWATLAITMVGVLSACSTSPRERVEDGLRDMGLPKRPAKCMAEEMDDRLDKRDMKTLAKFLEEAGERGDARPARILDTVQDLDDPAITEAAAKAGLSCTLLR